jgi:hypothetical protein
VAWIRFPGGVFARFREYPVEQAAGSKLTVQDWSGAKPRAESWFFAN